MIAHLPPPHGSPEAPLQALVANLDSSDYLGRIAIGRIFNGRVKVGDPIGVCKLDGTVETTRVTKLFTFEGLKRVDVTEAAAGDVICLAGIENIMIGETIADPEHPEPVAHIAVDEPTVSMIFGVNTSPLAGREGRFVTSRQIKDRLDRELLGNVAIRVEPTDSPEQMKVIGRGELQLSILIEMMRREGFELQVSRPEIVTKEIDGQRVEPVEDLVIDVAEDFQGVVIAEVGQRRGSMTKMVNHGSGRIRLEFRVPARGLIGFRSLFLTETRGTGLMHHLFHGWEPWHGPIPSRANWCARLRPPGQGDRLRDRQPAGAGRDVHRPCRGSLRGHDRRRERAAERPRRQHHKEKKQTNMRASSADEAIRLIPPRKMGLEQAVEFINDDELVEVTPNSIRLRKKILAANMRPKRAADTLTYFPAGGPWATTCAPTPFALLAHVLN